MAIRERRRSAVPGRSRPRTSEGWSGRRGSNPRPTAWKAVTLPLSYSRLRAPRAAPAALRRGRPADLSSLRLRASLTALTRGKSRVCPRPDLSDSLPTWPASVALCHASEAGPPQPAARSARAKEVARGGFEPPKPLGRQIYSLLRLTASLPRRLCVPRVDRRKRASFGEAR